MIRSKRLILALSVLVLVTMACTLNINLPVQQVNTGPTRTEEIHIPAPADPQTTTSLSLDFSAGVLKLQPGAQGALVDGQATYNVDDLKPKTTVSGSEVMINTGDFEIRGLPRFGKDFKNEWDLKIGDMPLKLEIKAGAYKGDFDLGGLTIESLQIGDGAAEVDLRFSQPNKVEMSDLAYETGASTVKLSQLANANFSIMTFKGGAGDYSLDFSGVLQRDAQVSITAGASRVTIIVPPGVPARVITTGGLSNVTVEDNWQKSGNDYTLEGNGPTWTIKVDLAAGNLVLRSR